MASINRRSNGKFQAKVRKTGYAEQSRTFDTEQEAVEWATALEAQIDSGATLYREASEVTPIRDIAALYYDAYEAEGLSVETTANLFQIKEGPLCDTMLADLTSEDVLAWIPERNELADLLEEVIEKSRRDFGMRIPSNPVTAAFAKPQTTRIRRLADFEEAALLEEAARTRGGYLTDAIIVDLDTALYQSELVALDWSDVNMDKAEIIVRSRKGDRIIPMTDRVRSVLCNRGIQVDGQVFEGLSTQALQRSFIRATERAKIADFHFMDLRHEAIFRMKDRHSLEEVWRISGVGMASLKRYYGTPND